MLGLDAAGKTSTSFASALILVSEVADRVGSFKRFCTS